VRNGYACATLVIDWIVFGWLC